MSIRQITTEELRQLQQAGGALKIVDVLPRKSYQLRHIPGAISIPLDEIGQRALQLLNKGDLVVVYCTGRECKDSAAAAEQLQAMGYDHVLNYSGGLQEYRNAGLRFAAGFDTADYSNCGC